MPLLLAGIDEAGYGPMLGPLCVGLAVFRVADEPDATKVPDLWTVLNKGVCRQPARGGAHDKRRRVAVADSKELKLANSTKTSHPLIHLERGVLAFLRCLADPSCAESLNDLAYFTALGGALADHTCYHGTPRVLPVSLTQGEVAIAHNVLSKAMDTAGVKLHDLRCEVICEHRYQRIVKETSNKAETTAAAFGLHLRRLWDTLGNEPEDVRLGLVCDRLGGRAQYAGLIERELPGADVAIVEETSEKSRYLVTGRDSQGRDRRCGIAFLVEGERAHLPVALASMVAKLTRELAMMRFNQHWGDAHRTALGAEIKPTAGYRNDAHRWLADIGEIMGEEDRRQLVRWV